MNMSISGSVKIDGHNCIFTQDGQWAISRLGVILGYVDTLAEIETFIAANLEEVRARLRRAQDEAAKRTESIVVEDS